MNPSNDSKKQNLYKPRDYRLQIRTDGLISFRVQVMETDLFILAKENLSERALDSVYKYRKYLNEYISMRPEFQASLVPISQDLLAPQIIRDMITCSEKAQVGPMAAVAGAIAQYVSEDLLKLTDDVIVENGGDNYIKSSQDLRIPVYAGESPLSMKIALKVRAEETPIGVCTSSGTIGHSLSFGKADAVCITSKSAVLADAAATAVGNRIKSESDIKQAIEYGLTISGVLGILIIIGDRLGVSGKIELS